jgi:NAD-reducing hydrogenase large subunit
MRKFGQEIIAATAGKKIHGTGAIPGGINKNLSIEERDAFLDGIGGDPRLSADQMVEWAGDAVEFFKDYHRRNKDLVDGFAAFPSSHLSIVRKDGALELYDGVIRAVDADGNRLIDGVDCQEYHTIITEGVKKWTYMKFPYLTELGPEAGWYRVGPLARLNVCDFIDTPRAQEEFEIFRAYSGGKPNWMSMHYHWARSSRSCTPPRRCGTCSTIPISRATDLVVEGERRPSGVGVIEAPRGTLFHHYDVDENDQITMCNLIVSTTHNNESMNRAAVNGAAIDQMQGRPVITEGMMNAVEVAIRAYDPCLSCATHALGKMPLIIEGLRRYKESTPDFILIDLMMEEVDAGTNLAKELRALRNEAPVYMLSSVGDDMNLTIDSDEIGFDGVLQKPMDPDALIALIRSKLKS